MAQDVASRQEDLNAAVISRMIEEMGKNISAAVMTRQNRQIELAKLQRSGMDELEKFKSLPAAQRQRMLQDPSFVLRMVKVMDPETFMNPRAAKKLSVDDLKNRINSIRALGVETPEETAQRGELEAKRGKAVAEQQLAEQKQRISSGVETPTPMSLLMAGDVKDPLAAGLFSTMNANDLANLAKFEKKVPDNPQFQMAQQQEWFKWGVAQGYSPGLAMATATAIAHGQWDKVPETWTDPATNKPYQVRGEAERKLAIDSMNAISRSREVQNTIESSIATSSEMLAEKAGIPPDQARADIMALRAGQKVPFPTPHLEEMAKLDEMNKGIEIQKNQQSILNDKTNMIRESLNSMLALYKEQGTLTGTMSGAQKKDLEDKMNETLEGLTQTLSGKYGVEYKPYSSLHYSVKGAAQTIWNSMKAGAAFSSDVSGAVDDYFKQQFPNQFPGLGARVPSADARAGGKLTPERENILKGLYQSLGDALQSDDIPATQKKSIKDYINNTLEPIFKDPSKFDQLFALPPTTGTQPPQQQPEQPPQQQEQPDLE